MPSTRRERIALALIVALSLGLRLSHLQALRGDVLFAHPGLDEGRYLRAAENLAMVPRPFWQPPGVIYVLAAAMRVARAIHVEPVLAAHVVTVLAGTASCVLAWLLARRLFGPRIAVATAAIVALHGALIFSSGELLPATWAGLFDLLALHFALDAADRPSRAALAGLALGVSALFTPVILPFAGLVCAWLLFERKRTAAIAVAIGTIVPIVPVALDNWRHGHELVLVSSNGGLNFFLGNNERYFDTIALRPGPRWNDLLQEPWRGARASTPGAQSSFFLKRGLSFWASHPLDALGLFLRKLRLFFHGSEIVRDADLYPVRSESPVLRALVSPRAPFFPDGVMIPLALVGLFASLRTRALRLPIAFVAAQAGCVALFFVSSRYRVPSLPVLAMFAAIGAVAIVRAPKTLGLAAVLLAVVCALPAREVAMHFPAEPDLFRGLAHRESGDDAKAIDAFRLATATDSHDPRPSVELAITLAHQQRLADAADAWERAGACDPWDLRSYREAAALRVRLGDRAAAIRDLAANIAAAKRPQAMYVLDWMRLVRLHVEANDEPAAMGALAGAIAADRRVARVEARELARDHRAKFNSPAFWTAVDAL